MKSERLRIGKDDRRRAKRAYALLWLGTLLAAIAAAALTAFALQRERSDPIPVESGDLSRTIGRIVDAMPGRGSEGYARPSPEEASEFADLASSMEAGDLGGARRSAEALDYTLVWYEDNATGRRLLMAREEADPSREAGRGWGTLVADPGGDDVLVEVPHPGFDIKTPQVGVELFRETEARVLLVAGAHRYAWGDKRSDVAHAPDTAFDAAHEALLPTRYVVQLHGFHSGGKGRYPEVVLSGGVAPAPAGVKAVYRSMKGAGIDVGLFDGGSRFGDLAGTTNVQGISAREAGSRFIHVELARDLRTQAADRSRLVQALAESLTQGRQKWWNFGAADGQ